MTEEQERALLERVADLVAIDLVMRPPAFTAAPPLVVWVVRDAGDDGLWFVHRDEPRDFLARFAPQFDPPVVARLRELGPGDLAVVAWGEEGPAVWFPPLPARLRPRLAAGSRARN